VVDPKTRLLERRVSRSHLPQYELHTYLGGYSARLNPARCVITYLSYSTTTLLEAQWRLSQGAGIRDFAASGLRQATPDRDDSLRNIGRSVRCFAREQLGRERPEGDVSQWLRTTFIPVLTKFNNCQLGCPAQTSVPTDCEIPLYVPPYVLYTYIPTEELRLLTSGDNIATF
jgi:hypothetical protein